MARITQIDENTGEIVGNYVAVIQPKKRNGFYQGWFAMSQVAIQDLREYGLTGRDYEVLFALLSFLDFENLIQVSQASLAKEIGMQKQHVNRAINKLIDTNVLIEGPKIGRSKTFKLNPNFGWKGTAKNHTEALKARMRKSNITAVHSGEVRDKDTIDFINGKADKDA